jgi:hypothetical protein
MKKHFLFLLAALFAAAGTARADATPSGLWSGDTDASWGSNYAESNEFYISTAAQLAQFAYMVNNSSKQFSGKTVRLIADIDLSAHYWVPIGNKEARAFAGTFDGQGHTVRATCFTSGSFPNTGNVFCGLFGVNGAKGTVSNVHVANSTFEARYNVGGVVAYNKGTVEYSSVASDVIVRSTAPVSGDQGAIRFAGIVASNLGTVRGCVSHADLSDHNGKERYYIGGIVAHNFGRVESCVFLGDAARLGYDTGDTFLASKTDRLGPIVGYSVLSSSYQASYGNNYYTQSADVFSTLDTGKSGASLAYTISCSTSSVSVSFDAPAQGIILGEKCYAPSGQSVQFRVVPDDFFKGVSSVTANDSPLVAINGKYTVSVASADIVLAVSLTEVTNFEGSGSAQNPFIIKSTEHWNALATAISEGNSNINKNGVSFFRLDADIAVTTMIGTAAHPFESSFDGNGHQLTVNYVTSDDYCAPFRYVKGAEIEGLTVGGTIQSSGHYAGGIIGHAEGTFRILNCIVKTHIESTGSMPAVYDGGFIGLVAAEKTGETTYEGSSVSIVGCVFEGTITSTENTCFGGFVGKAEGASNDATTNVTITNCLFDPLTVSLTHAYENDTFVITGNNSSVTIDPGEHAFYTKLLSGNNHGGTLVTASAYIPTEEPTIKYGMIDKYSGGLLYNGVYFSADHKGFYDDMDNMPLIGYYLNRGTVNAKFNGRKLYKDGAWNTLCLPFNMTAEQLSAAKTTEGHPLYGATIWEMDVTGWYNTSNQRSDTKDATFCYQTALSHQPSNISPQPSYLLYLYFQDATAIDAGKPYLVKWSKPNGYDDNPNDFDISNPVFVNVTIKASLSSIESDDGSVLFVPTFSPVALEKGNWQNLYVGAGNMLKYPSSSKNFTLNSFRGYFQLMAGDEPASNPLARSINFVSNIDDDNETTGIVDNKHETITNNHSLFESVEKHWYTLDGRKLDGKPTKKGLYIHNGNKLVIK